MKADDIMATNHATILLKKFAKIIEDNPPQNDRESTLTVTACFTFAVMNYLAAHNEGNDDGQVREGFVVAMNAMEDWRKSRKGDDA